MLKSKLFWILMLFAIFFVSQNPQQGAESATRGLAALGEIADGLSQFLAHLL